MPSALAKMAGEPEAPTAIPMLVVSWWIFREGPSAAWIVSFVSTTGPYHQPVCPPVPYWARWASEVFTRAVSCDARYLDGSTARVLLPVSTITLAWSCWLPTRMLAV